MLTRALLVAGLLPLARLGAGASAREACPFKPIAPVVRFGPGGLGAAGRRLGKLD